MTSCDLERECDPSHDRDVSNRGPLSPSTVALSLSPHRPTTLTSNLKTMVKYMIKLKVVVK
jgi:hypothetical protein